MIVEKNDFFKSEHKTIGSVFNNVYAFECNQQIIVASDNEIDFLDFLENNRYDVEYSEKDLIYTDDYVPLVSNWDKYP